MSAVDGAFQSLSLSSSGTQLHPSALLSLAFAASFTTPLAVSQTQVPGQTNVPTVPLVPGGHPRNPLDAAIKPRGADLTGTTELIVDAANSIYKFRYDGGPGDEVIEYEVDLSFGTPMFQGILEITETQTGIKPVAGGGLLYRPSDDYFYPGESVPQCGHYVNYYNAVEPEERELDWGTTSLLTGGVSVDFATRTLTINYGHTIDQRTENYFFLSQVELQLVGKAMRVHTKVIPIADKHDYYSNFTGYTTGRIENVTDGHDVKIPYMLEFPVVRATSLDSGQETAFVSSWIDLTKSRGQDIDKSFQSSYQRTIFGTDSITCSRITRYEPNSEIAPLQAEWSPYQMNSTVEETSWVIVTTNLEDTYARSEANSSPYKDLLASSLQVVGFFNRPDPNPWSDYEEAAENWSSFGMDMLSTYYFLQWNAQQVEFIQALGTYGCPPDGSLGNGSEDGCVQMPLDDWGPPYVHPTSVEPTTAFNDHMVAQELRGNMTGLYTGYDNRGAASEFPANNAYETHRFSPLPADDCNNGMVTGRGQMSYKGMKYNAERNDAEHRANHRASLVFVDILGPKHPDGFIDHNYLKDNAKEMRQNARNHREMLMSRSENMAGPVLTEGSGYFPHFDGSIYNAGYADAIDGIVNTGGGVLRSESTSSTDPLTRYNWWVMPDYTLGEMSRLQAKNGLGFMVRFECHNNAHQRPTGALTPRNGGYYHPFNPATEELFDKYRAYEITNGTRGHFETFGIVDAPGNRDSDRFKEYYMMQGLQEDYLRSKVDIVEYEKNGVMETASDILLNSTKTGYSASASNFGIMDELTNPRIHIRYESGLEIYVNHSDVDWVQHGFKIPEDGFLAFNAATGLLSFSAIPQGPGFTDDRIDYSRVDKRYEFFDGRGVVDSYLGMSNLGGVVDGNAVVHNLVHHIEVKEVSGGGLDVSSLPGTAPTLTKIELVGPNLIEEGSRALLRVVGSYTDIFGNVVAKQDVSHLRVSFSSNKELKLPVDRAGVIEGLSTGSARIKAELGSLIATRKVYIQ